MINAMRKRTPIPGLDYAQHLWHEKELTSVANVTSICLDSAVAMIIPYARAEPAGRVSLR